MFSSYIIGISGGSGSGKTTLANNLRKHYGQKVLVLHLDDYYVDREHLPIVDGAICWDHPDAIDYRRLVQELGRLKCGKPVETTIKFPRSRKPNDPPRKRKRIVYQPAHVIVVEGFLLLHYPSVRAQLDLSIFLDTDISRSVIKRVNQNENEAWYLQYAVLPMHEKYVLPSSGFATKIFNVDGKNSREVFAYVYRYITSNIDLLTK